MTSRAQLETGMAAHQKGRLDDAEAAYRRVLAETPDQPEALHFYGLLHYQRGRVDEGVAMIQRSLELDPGRAEAWNNLGNLHKRASRPEKAWEAYRAAIEIAPRDPDPWCNIGVLYRDAGRIEEAIRVLQHAVSLDERHPEAWHNLAMCHMHADQLEDAADAFERVYDGPPRRWQNPFWHFRVLHKLGRPQAAAGMLERHLEGKPDDPMALHHLRALRGEPVARAPDDYVRNHFDSFAASFDMVLDRVDYRAPALVAEQVRRQAGDQVLPDVVDLGCGTGLCGPLIQANCRQLVGVDLSTGMLRRAAERGAYTHLVEAELTEFLASVRPGSFDLAASVDTLCYLGDLGPVMRGLTNALKAGGLAIATVEAMEPGEGQGFRLDVSGRYSHSHAYLRETAETAGLDFLEAQECVLRLEFGEPVAGYVFTLAKPRGG